MDDLLKIDLTYSNYHLIFPRIIIGILIVLGILLLISSLIKKAKTKDKSKFQFKFFKENFNKLMFFGTIILLVLYGIGLEYIGFIPATIAFMILNTLLYIGNLKKKALVISIINSLATTFVIWFVFGQMFDITLP